MTYEIELPHYGKKIRLNLLNDEDFKIPYVIDIIQNSPDGHQIPTQAKKNVWIIDINIEDPTTDQDTLVEIHYHQT